VITLYVRDTHTGDLYLTSQPMPHDHSNIPTFPIYVGQYGMEFKDPLYFTSKEEVEKFVAAEWPNARLVWKRQEDLKADPDRWKAI
jgi:hypothetical protein